MVLRWTFEVKMEKRQTKHSIVELKDMKLTWGEVEKKAQDRGA